MKICHIAPLWERVPPSGYGGIELYLYDLLCEQARDKSLDVTIYATEDSIIPKGIRHIPMCPHPLRTDKFVKNPQAYYSFMLGRVFRDANKFDILHNHVDHNAFPFTQFTKTPMVTHLHSPLIPERLKVYREYNKNTYFVSISLRQQKLVPDLNYVANIYHGIPLEKFPFGGKPRDHLVWMGRISPEKDTGTAVQVARATGRKIILAGKVDPVDEDYFQAEVKPYIDREQVVYLGELSFEDKVNFLKDAYAFLMPLTWEEPFGLVLIESMACGTPVIAMDRGSVPEIVKNKVNGFVVKDFEEMVEAVDKVGEIKREACRKYVEDNFNVSQMALEHKKMYNEVIARHKKVKK